MGLFDFGKSKQPPEYFLNQRSGYALRKWAGEHGFMLYNYDTYVSIKGSIDFTYSSPLRSHWLEESGTEPMPKKFKDDYSANTVKVLEMALEKGDPEAPFYLAMMWKYGVASFEKGWDDRQHLFRPDEDKAAAYLTIARERGSAMEKAYQHLKETQMTGGANEIYTADDNLAERMAFATEIAKDDSTLLEILDRENATDFARLGVVLMAAGSNARMTKCSVVLGQALVLSVRENTKNDLWNKYVFNHFLIMPDDQERVKLGNYLLERVISQAAAGNERAAHAIKQYNIKC